MEAERKIDPAPEATPDDVPHRIHIDFLDDHTIDNAKIIVENVTPEQIAVAMFHLTRSANQVADMRQLTAERSAREISDMRRKLHLPGGRN